MLKMLLFIICEAPKNISAIFWPFLAIFTLFHFRGVAGKSFAGRQEVVALENYWIACKDLPMALVINSTMAT